MPERRETNSQFNGAAVLADLSSRLPNVDPAVSGEDDEPVQDATAVGAAVDVVAQGDERVFRARPDSIE